MEIQISSRYIFQHWDSTVIYSKHFFFSLPLYQCIVFMHSLMCLLCGFVEEGAAVQA